MQFMCGYVSMAKKKKKDKTKKPTNQQKNSFKILLLW